VRAALCALAGCSIPSTDLPGEQVLRGAHVTLHADPQLPICQTAIDDADAYVADTATYLGAAVPAITYVVHDRRDDSCGFGSEYIADCTIAHTIFAYNWISYRELANAVVWDWGHPPALFSEGLGGALAGPPTNPVDRATADVAAIEATTSFFAGTPEQVTSHFDIANDFATFLLQRDGVAKMRALTQQLVYLSDPLTIEQTFDHVYGATLGDAIAAWRTEAPIGGALPLDTLACSAPEVAADPTGTFALSEPACAGGKTVAGGSIEQPMRHVIDLPASGLYQIGTATAQFATTEIASCNGTEPMPPAEYVGKSYLDDSNQSLLLALDAGPHALRFDMFAYPIEGVDLGTWSWTVTPVGPQSATCASAPPLSIAPGSRVLFESSPARWPRAGATAETWLRVDPGSAQQVVIDCFLTSAFCAAGTVQLCTKSCGPSMRCQPATEWTPALGAPFWIDLTAPPDLPDVVELSLRAL
jgi:hypothetical protein